MKLQAIWEIKIVFKILLSYTIFINFATKINFPLKNSLRINGFACGLGRRGHVRCKKIIT